jgi:precorrin-6A/cobalt-precorrin-6A reductase
VRMLILGGTGDARELANRLVAEGHDVTSSLAGRTREPILPQGDVRVGKFGGVPGLSAYLKASRIDWLIDATHPYAGLISVNAVLAAKVAGVRFLRLMRPAWDEPEGAGWLHAGDVAEAAQLLPTNAQVLLSTGHKGLDTFLERNDCTFLVRVIDAPDLPLPPHAELVVDRPPYSVAGETALMRENAITHLVTKNSGGAQTQAKLDAARALSVAVIMIARPPYPPAPEAGSVAQALAMIHEAASGPA